MATSSIHIETSSAGALIHNERVFSPDYLITNNKNINEYKSYTNLHISDLEKRAKIDYQKYSKNNRKLPSNATLIKEAILNLNENHKMEDLEKIKQTLENEYGYKISNMSIHRDEGYIYTSTKNYTMGKNQFKNLEDTPHIAELDSKDNKFYEWNLNNNKWVKGNEIKDYKIEKNYHAHIVMLNYDFTKHRTIRNNLKELSKMQTLVARDLSMERGKCSSTVEAQRIGVEVEQSRKRLNIKEYKIQKRKENELQKELEKEKKKNIILEKEIYNFRETQKEITALTQLSVEDRKALHQLNTMCKNNKISPSELEKKINNLINSYNNQTTELSEKDELILKLNEKINHHDSQIVYIENLQKQIDDLQKQIDDLLFEIETKVSQNFDEEIENLKKENESLKNENSFLNGVIDKVINYANYKIKELINFGKPQFKKSVSLEDFKEEDKKEDTHKSNLNGLEVLNKNLDNFVSSNQKKEDLDYSEYHNNLRQP